MVAPISSPNQHERSFSKTTTAKLTCSSHFAFSSILISTWQKGKDVHEEPGSHSSSIGSTGHPKGAKPPRHPCSQGSLPSFQPSHLCNTSAAISPDSHGDVQGIFEKRHLKGIKWRLRNKKQQAINKFPKVWETLSCALPAHFKVSCAPWRSLSHRQAAGAESSTDSSHPCCCQPQSRSPFCPARRALGLWQQLKHCTSPLIWEHSHPNSANRSRRNPFILSFLFLNYISICVSFKKHILTFSWLSHLPPPPTHILSKNTNITNFPKKSIHWGNQKPNTSY